MRRRLARRASALLSAFLLPGLAAAASRPQPVSGKPVATGVSAPFR